MKSGGSRHIAVACRGETYRGRIDPCLDDAIQTRQIQLGGGLGIDDDTAKWDVSALAGY
jgi:hypothetical protein